MQKTEHYNVFVDGIFDLFHAGHENIFRQAVQKGEERAGGRQVRLFVGVCGDGVSEYKRNPIMDLDERCAAVRANRLVHRVIPNSPIRLNACFLREHKIQLVVHGDDFDKKKADYYYGAAAKEGNFALVPYTKGISTTELIFQAKENGEFPCSVKPTLLNECVLIERIKKRSWEDLGIRVLEKSPL